MKLLSALFNKQADLSDVVYHVFAQISQASRKPIFYAEWGVKDHFSGRFDMLCLHASFVFRLIQDEKEFAQDLFDYMFATIDQAIRQAGIGDLSVGKKIKYFAQIFYGQVMNLSHILEEREPTQKLKDFVARNYGLERVHQEALVAYILKLEAQFKHKDVSQIMSLDFVYPK